MHCMALMRRYALALFLPLYCFTSCRSRAQLPARWTPETSLRIYHGGGMVPESFTVEIGAADCLYLHWQQPRTDSFPFRLTDGERDSLLTEMNNRNFTSLVSGDTKGIVYDKPTTSIEMNWPGHTHKVSIGATEEIREGDPADFHRLWSYIIGLALQKTGQRTGQ